MVRSCVDPWPVDDFDPFQSGLDLFIIVMTIFSALERPYQKQADVVTTLQKDGAKMFLVSFQFRTYVRVDAQAILQCLFGELHGCCLDARYSPISLVLRTINLIMSIVGDVSTTTCI
jgi:hypothetical protein